MSNYIKYILALIAAIAGTVKSPLVAQQAMTYNQYYLNSAYFNPASIGMDNQLDLFFLHKNYLTGISGSPSSSLFSVSSPVGDDQLNVGVQFLSETQGVMKQTEFKALVAKQFQITQDHLISFGMSFGGIQSQLNSSEVIVEVENEPLLLNKNFSTTTPTADFSIQYRWSDFQLMTGANRLFASKATFSEDPELNYTFARNFFASAQYDFYMDGKHDWRVSPLIMTNFTPNGTRAHQGALWVSWKEMAWASASYKQTGGMGITVGGEILSKIQVGYSYETILKSPINVYQNGGHEIAVRYRFEPFAKSLKNQQEQLDRLDGDLSDMAQLQLERDQIQDKMMKDLKFDNIENQEKLALLDKQLTATQHELEQLKVDLKAAGLLQEASAADFSDSPLAGYYMVIASVSDKNYSESAMKSEFLDKGYSVVHNTKRGWYYVYTIRHEDFPSALSALKTMREGEHKKTWIHILK